MGRVGGAVGPSCLVLGYEVKARAAPALRGSGCVLDMAVGWLWRGGALHTARGPQTTHGGGCGAERCAKAFSWDCAETW